MTVFFYIAALIAIFSTIMVITRTNVIHALLYMVVSLLSTAVMFFIIGAPFVAALEIMIYAGAIIVLFVFVIMMLNLGKTAIDQEKKWLAGSGWIVPSVLALILLVEFIYIVWAAPVNPTAGISISPRLIGRSMFSTYLIGVELSAVLLLAGIIGAFHLARKKKHVVHRFLQETEGAEQ